MFSLWVQIGGIKRHTGQFKYRRTHVHAHASIGLEAGLNDAAQRFNSDSVFGRQALVAHEAQKAARAVAALLDFTTIGVVDNVLKVDAGARRGPRLAFW
jgi:hypothetical protein